MSKVLSIQNLSHQYGSTSVFSDINLDIAHGEWVGLLGGSGCGKTTLLRCIAGLTSPTAGTISMEKKEITHIHPSNRNVGLVFQDYALFPTCTVQENIQFGRKSSAPSCAELLSLVSLENMEHRLPAQLSGGQQQRVALARALAAQPKLLLLDEPFANIDAFKKSSLIDELRNLLQDVAVIFVTHDRSDAMAIADRLAVFDQGGIAQIDQPQNIYTCPNTIGIAEKTGLSTIITGSGDGDSRESILGTLRVHPAPKSCHEILIRPEDFRCQVSQEGSCTIEQMYYLGGRYQYWIRQGTLRVAIFEDTYIPKGTKVQLIQKNTLWMIPNTQ